MSQLRITCPGRIQRLLQKLVQPFYATGTPMHRRKHLHILQHVVSPGGQKLTAKGDNMLLHPFRVLLFNKNKVTALLQRASGQTPGIDSVGIHDYTAVIALTKNFRQAHPGNYAAAKDILQHGPRPHCRKLVHIPCQYQVTTWWHCLQKMAHQHDVHHRNLVQNNHIRLKRLILIAPKA